MKKRVIGVCAILFSFVFMNFCLFTFPNIGPKFEAFIKHFTQFEIWRTETDIYALRIIVIVYNRDKSLLRLLNSLNKAFYGSDKVKLEVWIDRSVDGNVSLRTIKTAENFTFIHGHYSVNVHPKHAGIYGQWISTWKPDRKSPEQAVILEDDLTVSPYFYKYLKLVHNTYDNRNDINGYSLQGVSIKHHVHDNSPLAAPNDSIVFLYPVIGTWGFSPNRRNWIKFTDWYNEAIRNSSFQPFVPGNIASKWFQALQKKGKGGSMWSIWHIYYAWKHKEFTLYPNFGDHAGLSVNWKEKGLHYKDNKRGQTDKLLTEWKTGYEILPNSPVILDIKGKISHTEQ